MVWRESDYESTWGPFDRQFAFAPNFYERTAPAIELPVGALVVNLSPIFAHEGPRFASGAELLTWLPRHPQSTV